MDLAIVITAVLNFLVLIVFLVMSARLRDIKISAQRGEKYLSMILQLTEKDLTSKGLDNQYYIFDGKVNVKDKKTGKISEKTLYDWHYMQKSEFKDDYELVKFENISMSNIF